MTSRLSPFSPIFLFLFVDCLALEIQVKLQSYSCVADPVCVKNVWSLTLSPRQTPYQLLISHDPVYPE